MENDVRNFQVFSRKSFLRSMLKTIVMQRSRPKSLGYAWHALSSHLKLGRPSNDQRGYVVPSYRRDAQACASCRTWRVAASKRSWNWRLYCCALG